MDLTKVNWQAIWTEIAEAFEAKVAGLETMTERQREVIWSGFLCNILRHTYDINPYIEEKTYSGLDLQRLRPEYAPIAADTGDAWASSNDYPFRARFCREMAAMGNEGFVKYAKEKGAIE